MSELRELLRRLHQCDTVTRRYKVFEALVEAVGPEDTEDSTTREYWKHSYLVEKQAYEESRTELAEAKAEIERLRNDLSALRKAQNRVRKQYGIGKTQLLARMNAHYSTLLKFCLDATWQKAVDCDTKGRVHWLIDSLAADSIIASAYREAERNSTMGDAASE